MRSQLVFFFILLLSLLIPKFGISQNVIGSAGENFSNAQGQISTTVGEAIINTEASGNEIITQGFHQTKLVVLSIDVPDELTAKVKIFPNPVSAQLNIESDLALVQLKIVDSQGKMIFNNKQEFKNTSIETSTWSAGVYYVFLWGKNSSIPLKYKVVKSH